MYHVTELVDIAMTEVDLKHRVEVIDDKLSWVEVGFSGNNADIVIRVISCDDDNDAKVLSESIAKVPKENGPRLIR